MMRHKTRQVNDNRSSGFSEKLKVYLNIHAQALFSSLGRIVNNTFTSMMTILVMALVISMASGVYLLVVNMQQLTGGIESSNQISLFLKSNISDRVGNRLVDRIKQNEDLNEVVLITKEQALIEFKTYSGFGDALDILETNPLPVVIQVVPKNTLDDTKIVSRLVAEFERLPQVDFVQLDMQWVQRLQSMTNIIKRAVFVVTLLLGFAVLIITGNTIRLELQSRQEEVMVAKLVGATHSFIQRPFLYTGFWLGLLSGITALLLVSFILLTLQGPIEKLSILYDGTFNLEYFGLLDIISLFGISSALGIIGAWIVLHFQLKKIKPR